ncbi:hypothetical protein [Phenylobacterium sp.]|uniref:hypothetical protein n=1 Tax=Phenylobacterium sp. TaxID=1871053 RepID=UPI002FC7B4C2
MTQVFCRYATASTEAYVVHPGGQHERVTDPPRDLCAWAQFHPASAEKLTDTPPWLQRNALAGHLMRAADCATCPCFERGEPVE